jgi:putative drug exporter of the RND superfamily
VGAGHGRWPDAVTAGAWLTGAGWTTQRFLLAREAIVSLTSTPIAPAAGRRPASWAGTLVARRRWAALLVLAGIVTLAVPRLLVGGNLTAGGIVPPGADSQRAATLLAERFGVHPSGLVAIIDTPTGPATGPTGRRAATRVAAQLRASPAVLSVSSYLDAGAPGLVSNDGRAGLVVASLAGDDQTREDEARTLAGHLRADTGPVRVLITGADVDGAETSHLTAAGLVRAELVALPIVLILLGWYLRRVLLALVPLVAGGLAIAAGLLAVGLLASVMTMASTATNMVTGLALGLCVDYALLIISRYREELAHSDEQRPGADRAHALAVAVSVAGRTVAFSAATVAIALATLALFPVPFLRSMAVAGVVATLAAAVCSLAVIPACLAGLGARVGTARLTGPGRWRSFTVAVMRRPGRVGLPIIAVLVVVFLPFTHLRLGVGDERSLPTSNAARQGGDLLRSRFSGLAASPIQVVLTPPAPGLDRPAPGLDPAAVGRYATTLSHLPGVALVQADTGTYASGHAPSPPTAAERAMSRPGAQQLAVVPSVDPLSAAGSRLVRAVRATPAPEPAVVGGTAAQKVDLVSAITGRLPLVLAVIGVISFLALWMMFSSPLVSLLALVLSLLSLSATFGAAVWIFQDGHLSGLLGFTAVGTLVAPVPILVFSLAFGLSMDYQVFILSRIREEYDFTGDPVESVATGLDRVGRIVTFAAALVAVVFAGFVVSSVAQIKLLGLGLALAVLLDALVIRSTLLPALLRLTGRATWWEPAPLRRLRGRLALRAPERVPGELTGR